MIAGETQTNHENRKTVIPGGRADASAAKLRKKYPLHFCNEFFRA